MSCSLICNNRKKCDRVWSTCVIFVVIACRMILRGTERLSPLPTHLSYVAGITTKRQNVNITARAYVEKIRRSTFDFYCICDRAISKNVFNARVACDYYIFSDIVAFKLAIINSLETRASSVMWNRIYLSKRDRDKYEEISNAIIFPTIIIYFRTMIHRTLTINFSY